MVVIELKEKLLQTNKGDKEYRGRSQKFVDGGKEKRVQWIHNVEVITFDGYTILRSLFGMDTQCRGHHHIIANFS